MTDPTVTIAGQTFPIRRMSDGQVESLFRIQRSLASAGDSNATFYGRQLARMGDLIDGLLSNEADVDRLDKLFLAGETSTAELVSLVFAAYKAADEAGGDVPAIVAKKKPATAITAKKAPAKKATRAGK
jgi:hypothetical protein